MHYFKTETCVNAVYFNSSIMSEIKHIYSFSVCKETFPVDEQCLDTVIADKRKTIQAFHVL